MSNQLNKQLSNLYISAKNGDAGKVHRAMKSIRNMLSLAHSQLECSRAVVSTANAVRREMQEKIFSLHALSERAISVLSSLETDGSRIEVGTLEKIDLILDDWEELAGTLQISGRPIGPPLDQTESK